MSKLINSRAGWRMRLVLLAFLFVSAPSHAATVEAIKTGSDAATVQKLIDDARESGAKIVVIEASGAANTGDKPVSIKSMGEQVEAQAFQFRDRLSAILAGASGFVGETLSTLRGHDPDRSLLWVVLALLFASVYLTVGYGVERAFRAWARPHFAYMFNPEPQSRAEKIAYLLLTGFLLAISIALQILTAVVLIVAFASESEHIRTTQFVFLGSIAAIRILAVFFRTFLAIGAPSHRMVHATDNQAEQVYGALLISIIVIGTAIGMCLWMEALGLNEDAHKLGLIGATLISSTLFSIFAVRRRTAVAAMLLGPDPETKPTWWRVFARIWHGLAVLYAVAAFCVTVVRLVLDIPDVFALVTGPVVVLLAAMALNGIALLVIEWAFGRHNPATTPLTIDGDQVTRMPDDDDDEAYALERDRRTFKDVVEHAAAILIAAFAAWAIFGFWGVDLAQRGTIAHAVWEVVLIVFLAWLSFEAVDIAIDRKIEAEGGYITAAPGEEGGGVGTSRITTLLPTPFSYAGSSCRA